MAILNILQLNYFLCCVNQICFQQVFLTAQGRNWAKLLYIGASPKAHTDTADLEAEWWDYSEFHGDEHRLLSKYMSKVLPFSVVISAPTSALTTSEIPKEHISAGWH